MTTEEQPVNEDNSSPLNDVTPQEEAQPTGMTQSNPAIRSGDTMRGPSNQEAEIM